MDMSGSRVFQSSFGHLVSQKIMRTNAGFALNSGEMAGGDTSTLEPLPNEALTDVDGLGQGGLPTCLFDCSADRGYVHGAILAQLVDRCNIQASGTAHGGSTSVPSMSKKRPLTDFELAIAKRLKSAIASSANLTEERVGAELGISQGAVSHWTNGRLPVPAKRAQKLAHILGIDDPAEISIAYRDISRHGRDDHRSISKIRSGPASAVAMDPETLSETMTMLIERDHKADWVTFIREQPERFIEAYEVYAQARDSIRSAQDERRLGMLIADITPRNQNQDQLGDESGNKAQSATGAGPALGTSRKRKA